MPIVEARIETTRPERYLVQFCRHAAKIGDRRHRFARRSADPPQAHAGAREAHAGEQAHAGERDVTVRAEWTDTEGSVTFTPWGVCTLAAEPGVLTVRITADTDRDLRRIRDIVTGNLRRFSAKAPLTVPWAPVGGAAEPSAPARCRTLWVAGVVVALAVVGHVVLGGTALAASDRAAWGVALVGAVIAAKVVLVIGGRRGWRHLVAARGLHRWPRRR